MQRFRKLIWIWLLILVTATSPVAGQTNDDQPNKSDLHELVDQLDLDPEHSPLTEEERVVANLISERVAATEWLGAMGPVALSPFFGLTCLSGIAILGEDRLPEDHYLLRASSPLKNPLVFFTFLALTIITSIPRFSKVSKPFAQAVDQLETYSAIVILLVVRFMGGIEMGGGSDPEVAIVYQAGVFEFSAEALLILATIANIIVINTVKFFFEIMIWITPVPFIDACFEALNKSMCAALAAVYAFSPTIATIINLVLLGACLLVFRWIYFRVSFYRTILFDFVRNWWNLGTALPRNGRLVVFPKKEFKGIAPLSRCELSKSDDGWRIRWHRVLRPRVERTLDRRPVMKAGLLMNSIKFGEAEFQFGKRYNRHLAQLAEQLGATCDDAGTSHRPSGSLAAELA